MDYDKLIEQLNAWNEQHLSVVCGGKHFACDYLCENEDCIVVRAASALSTLQAENEKLRNEVERQRRSADDRKHLYENAERAYMKVVAELEQVKAERDAAIDCCSGYCATCRFVKDCAKHDMNDAAPIRWYYGDCEDWEWCGQKED